jgi:hypothetical protein
MLTSLMSKHAEVHSQFNLYIGRCVLIIFGRVRTFAKSDCYFCDVFQSARNYCAPAGRIFRKSVQKTQVPLKCDKNNGHFT